MDLQTAIEELEITTKAFVETLYAAAVKALDWIETADHRWDCPRIRDDYTCTCGRDDALEALCEVFND